MASPPAAPRLPPIALLALAALISEVAAWWWIGTRDHGTAAFSPAMLLGLLGMALAMAAGGLLLRRVRLHQHEAQQARELLVTVLDALPIGIAIFDQHDRLMIRNKCYGELFAGPLIAPAAQERLETMLRRELKLALPPEAIGHEDEWIARRLAERGSSCQPVLQRHPVDRWIHSYEVRTRHGFTVVARAEVTNLVRKEQLLAQANEQLVRQSATDGLTGIANRRRFDQTLASEWLRAARNGSALSLLMVDIDHFKRYNDHHGHLAGDECLRRVTEALAACIRRAGELLARYGGEEFVLLLPGADLAQAKDMAQRCLDRIEQVALPHGSSPTAAHVTFSIGVAHVLPDAATSPDTLVNAADTAMYRAKTAGRARYAVANLADWEIDKDAPRTQPGELC